MFSTRLKQAREAAGFTVESLAEKLGISAIAIEKYEHGENMPSSTYLHKLAHALGIQPEYFYRPVRAAPESLKYRKHSGIHEKVLDQINIDVLEHADRWLEMLDLYPETVKPVPEFALPGNLPDNIKYHVEIETVANTLRHEWELGLKVIPDLIDTLESRGVMVISTTRTDNKKFIGLAGVVNAIPFIMYSLHQPGDRQRFVLAYELGRLVLQERLSGVAEEEAYNYFAGAFLLPQQAIIQHIGAKRLAIEPRELYLLKHEFGISLMSILERLGQCGIISESIQKSYAEEFNKHAWHTDEPGKTYPTEEAILYKQLVYRALGEGYIDESKAAEFLGVTISSFQKERKLGQEGLNVNQGFLWKSD